jgi:DNA helicase HerA-like ATPase
MMNDAIALGAGPDGPVAQLTAMSNRHGLIAGATGTGKTVTLQVLAEGFSRAGVPVFAADVKGDLSGLGAPGKPHAEVERRVRAAGLDEYAQRSYPVLFWDVFGESGHPVRTTVSEFGPLLLGSLLELNETQTGILYACFSIADDEGLLLLDLVDLRDLLAWMGENAAQLRNRYGNITTASIGAIQRRLLVLEEQGAERLFGEPALALADLMQRDASGRGVISLLSADRLLREAPGLYAAFLLWLLSELFEELPEAGDLDAPKLVLFFDEAHLLFDGMSGSLVARIEQVVRLVRSKGVGVYFVTQSPQDLPETVLGQLGLKVQHALRAFTPKDRKVIGAVAAGFRNDEGVDVAARLVSMGTGEALVSTLDARGAPGNVIDTLVAPPESRIGPLGAEERRDVFSRSLIAGRYDTPVDRDSAHEMLQRRREELARHAEQEAERNSGERARARTKTSNRQTVGEAFAKSAARSIGSALGSRLARGILGSLLKGWR